MFALLYHVHCNRLQRARLTGRCIGASTLKATIKDLHILSGLGVLHRDLDFTRTGARTLRTAFVTIIDCKPLCRNGTRIYKKGTEHTIEIPILLRRSTWAALLRRPCSCVLRTYSSLCGSATSAGLAPRRNAASWSGVRLCSNSRSAWEYK